jgi:hypothetical protein
MATMSTPEQQDKRIELIADGREAIAMMGIIQPYVDGRILNLVQLMAAHYRKGTATHDVLLGSAAQITCLMDLLSDLDNRARRGDIAMQQEMANGTR